METESHYKVIAIILFVLLFFSYTHSHSLSKKNVMLEDRLSEYQTALSEANDNIDEANSMIEDAQSNAWSNYQSMGDALDNLSTIDTVSEPY